ncbi:immunoglobulin superfamily member 1-like [Trichosurus vulpecula]|uniref:immunoglobulin superfamily member 1-like n=1 Tax=Trichosurus vulpecula TaxID=9337 RepID=UPI00186B54D9|nr:immunoglobulin superfamily member 1-like [Trichosurus vulpecula]
MSGLVGEGTDRPTLWAIPSTVVPDGADVIFRCQGHLGSDRFQLWKDGELRDEKNASRPQAEFLLIMVGDWRDARSYSCRSGQGPLWSELSEPLALVVTGALPQPSISVSPDSTKSPGTTVTISCQIPLHLSPQDYSFALLEAKSLEPLQRQSPAGTRAAFLLASVRVEDTGSYSCIYYRKRAPHRGSLPSRALELTVPGFLPRPTLWAQPSLVVAPGANIILWCSRPKLSSLGEVIFTLWKAGTQKPLQRQTSADLWSNFPLTSVRPSDTGSYSCTYMDQTTSARGSEPSEALELVVPDSLPKPSILAWPGSEVASGSSVTLLCWGRSWGSRFVLYKEGEEKTLPSMHTSQGGVQFFLTQVTPKDSGSYSCSYQLVTNGNFWKQHSEPLQLIVRASELSYTLIITLSCVAAFFLLLCLLLLAFFCHGSFLMGEWGRKE